VERNIAKQLAACTCFGPRHQRLGAVWCGVTCVVGCGMWGVLRLLQSSSLWWQLILGTVVGGVVYLLAAILLRVHELRRLWQYGRQRFGR